MSTVHAVRVRLYGQDIGTIERRGGSTTFTYHETYAATPGSTPLSLSMPLASSTHDKRVIEAFLDGLLPDHALVRSRWAQTKGVRDGDTLSLVAAVGRDVAGAAQFLADVDDTRDDSRLVAVDEARIAARLTRLRESGVDWIDDDDDASWSLAGAQSKFALARQDSTWAYAYGDEPSTHIVKPGITRLQDQALVEHVSMRTLDSLGLPVARTQYVEFGSEPAIVIERYDRRAGRGRVLRVHQEDLLQAFALMPERKYESDEGPGLQKIGSLLGRVDPGSRQRFADAIIVNYLLGAPDAHAKNYSLLLAGNRATLAPLYDVASGLPYSSGDSLRWETAAMAIGGERRFGAVQAKHWRRAAANIGIDEGVMLDRVAELAASMPDAISDQLAALDRHDVRERLQGTLLPRAARLAQDTIESLTTDRSPRWGEGRATTIAAASPQPRRGRGLGGGQFMAKPRHEASGSLDA
jgi:serine/threonine-protein kinase HipA